MSKFSTPEAVNAEINGTLALLNSKTDFDASLQKKVVLVVGLTGTGKSTLCHFLAGNPKLKAVKIGGEYIISDGNEKVSDSTTESKTLMPELVPIPNTDTVLVDCPGFSDTRSARHDIAAAVFTKNLLEKAEKVKIMVAIGHHSVRVGNERKGFTDLLSHLVHFIKDIDKYEDSIGLLVTKVDNKTEPDDNGDYKLIPDNEIINETGAFLKGIKKELVNKTDDENVFKQIKLINIFIGKNDRNEFSKIGIFRRPAKVGNLNLDRNLQKNKSDIEVINKVLRFSQASSNDFGLAVSVDSKYIVNKMRDTLNANLSNILDDYIRVCSQPPLDAGTDNIERMKAILSRSININGFLQSAIAPGMVVTNLMGKIEKIDPGHPAQQYADWMKQQKIIQFLDSITPAQENSNDFSKYHKRFNYFKEKISDNVMVMGHSAEKTIDAAIDGVLTQVLMAAKNETVNVEMSSHQPYSKMSEKINDVYNLCEQFHANNQKKQNISFKEFLNDFKAKFIISKNHAQKLTSYQSDIEFFKGKTGATFTDGHQDKWLQGFTLLMNEIKEVALWASFIADSYVKLIEYDSQNAVSSEKSNLKNWENFQKFRKALGTTKAVDSYLESRPTLSSKQQIDLNNLIDATVRKVKFSCESSKLIIKGNFIKLSEVNNEFLPKCPSSTELHLFATQTVFFDESLIKPNQSVYIIAPIWDIRGTKTISLKGLDANLIGKTPAGDPGQPGGNFIGIGENFVNGNELTIDVSGGNGGNGNDGYYGRNGQDGMTPPVPETTSWHRDGSHDYCDTRIKKDEIAGFSRVSSDVFEMYGTEGTPGSRGGNGGKPGFGAKQGHIFVNSEKITKLARLGKNGKVGKGGKGGVGGEHGQTRSIKCTERTKPFWFKFEYETIYLISQDRANDGDNGVAGVEGTTTLPAPPPPFLPLPALAVQYKQYVQQQDLRFVDPLEFINRNVPNSRKQRSIPAVQVKPIGDNINWKSQYLAIDHKIKNLGTKPWSSEFSLTSFVALADVFIRKFMKTEPTNAETQVDPNWENLLVQAEVLKIVEKCEEKWNELNQTIPQETPFDPICLQKALTKRVRQLADPSQVQQIEAEIMEKMFA